ncbi:MAG: hypothetical protein QOH66_3077 [Actinomycetota bacterium]|nr:hypothetical protein [Actinomycetota bacterium]
MSTGAELDLHAGNPDPELIPAVEAAKLPWLVEAWRSLAASIPSSSYFQTPDWALTWWEVQGRPPADIAVWRNPSGAVEGVGFWAHVRMHLHSRVPVRIPAATIMGAGAPHAADHCGWPVLPHRLADVRRWIGGHDQLGTVVFQNLDPDTGLPLLPPGCRRVAVSHCPRLTIPHDLADLPVSSKFGNRLRHYCRRLEQEGVTFSWTGPGQMSPDVVDLLFSLHENRSRAREGASNFHRDLADFHRKLIICGRPDGGPASVTAFHDGSPVGILYGFLWGDTFSYYQGGWETAWSDLRLGHVLFREALAFLGGTGAKVFDFLRGAEGYKYQWGAVDRVDETWVLPRGIPGWALIQKYRAVRALGNPSDTAWLT